MNRKSALLLLAILLSFIAQGQKQADLTQSVKVPAVAGGAINDIDSLEQILQKKFVVIANDPNSDAHKKIQSFFDDYRMNPDNKDYYIYPQKINRKNVTVQYINYSTNYGWIGQTMDSVYYHTMLAALIFIPAYDAAHKYESVHTICFKATLEIDSEALLKSDKCYKNEVGLTYLKEMNLED